MKPEYQLADLDPSIIVEPEQAADSAVIWLHGLGADGHDFVGILPQLNLPEKHKVRFVFPNAPVQPVTVNGGMAMRSWYDIYSMTIAEKMDLHSIALSSRVLRELIEQQLAQGIAAEKIVIAGFSQGGLVALNTALSSEYSLAGVMALSTYYPSACLDTLAEPNHSINTFMVHGTHDPVIPYSVAETSYHRLLDLGCTIEWHTYPMEHQVCMQEIEDISNWLKARLDL